MSLTSDWKAGKLRDWYICRILIENKEHICPVFISGDENDFEIVEVIAPCNYDLWVALTEKVETLSSGNKHLRQLLTECKDWINWAYVELQEYDEDHKSQEIENLLTQINEVLNG